jgi:hypothetical protein
MATDYYNNKLKEGKVFQNYVYDLFKKDFGATIENNYDTKEKQLKGENQFGLEIKFDGKRKNTHNLYIEIAEKSNSNNSTYVISGIFRMDNTWLYAIGDYDKIYLFSKKDLIGLCNSKYKDRVFEIPMGTSKGFLLPEKEAKDIAIKIWEKE